VGTILNASEAFQAYMKWAASREWHDFSPATRHRAILILADNLSAACSAVDEPEVRKFRERAVARGPSGESSVLAPGRPRLATEAAAVINGLAMGWNEMDEGYRKAVCHAGLYVLPALLAAAEEDDSTVQDVLRATILGYDAVARIARTWRFEKLRLHPHAVLGPVGAAAGVAFLRRVPLDELTAAVSGACAMGLTGAFNQATQGVLIRNAWAGESASIGLHAVEFAACGIGGSALTPHDVYSALDAVEALEYLDPVAWPVYAVEDGYHKMNACCQYAHSSIEAVQALLAKHPQLQQTESISRITVQVHALGIGLDDASPATTLGGKFSVPHAVASTFVHGHGGVAAFNSEALNTEAVASLRQRIQLEPFPDPRPWPEDRPARVTVATASGEQYSEVCWSAQGGPDRPFSEEVLWEKIEALSDRAAPGLSAAMRRLDAAASSDADKAILSTSWSNYIDDFFRAA
jgi:2-methylcitrate dehydratase PrpD